jgi:hypothetical protein
VNRQNLPDWAKQRLAELETRAPVKRAKKEDVFVTIPLWFAAVAAEATRSPALLVVVYVLYCGWKAKGQSFVLPNGWLERRAVTRWVKCRALRKLEEAGLITVEWRGRKSPRITIHL